MKSILNKLNFLKNIDLEKIKKIPWVLGFYAFPIILILFLISLIFGEFLLYKYAILVKEEEPKIIENTLKFEHGAYQKILGEWQTTEQQEEQEIKESNFNFEKHPSPFITKSKTSY